MPFSDVIANSFDDSGCKSYLAITGFVCLTFLAGCAGSKTTTGVDDSSAPMKTNTIVVETDTNAAYVKAANVLQNRGYTFRSTDETLETISTEFTGVAKRYGVDNTFVRLGVNVEGNSVTVKGWYKTLENEDTETGQRIRKFGQNGSPMREAWKELYETANAVGDSLKFQ